MVNYLISHKSLFEDWLINTKKLKNARYSRILETVMADLREHYPYYESVHIFSIATATEIERMKEDYLAVPTLAEKDKSGNRYYTAAINRYIEYLKQKEILVYYEEYEQKHLNDFLSPIMESKVTYKGQKKLKPEPVIDEPGNSIYPRDPVIAANAVKFANYQCEIDTNHPSFIRRTNGENYTESHHLIPMAVQEDFEYSLDVEENVVSLCSNCHNCLHYGADESREEYLDKLFDKRKVMLEKVGLEIELEALKKYYNFKE
ncbi:MAG: HNH endonuclease [Culicoidibacterales bacterium]